MGNCIIKESSMQWGGDDWGADFPTTSDDHNLFSGGPKKKLYNNSVDKFKEKGSLSSPDHNDLMINKAANTTATRDQVKIKITRKQLEEILGRSSNYVQAGQGLSVQEVVAHFINGSHEFDAHQRSWRPALPTITEVN